MARYLLNKLWFTRKGKTCLVWAVDRAMILFVLDYLKQMMRVATIPQHMFPGDGSGSTQMHQQVQFIHNGGAPNQNAGGHPNNSNPPSNPNAPT
jgi:hypothetical protein